MNQYKIYEHPNGIQEAVKIGWSWPGFFFNCIWCFIKKMNNIGAIILAVYFSIYFLGSPIILPFINIGLCIWIGSEGNKLLMKSLLERGYEFKLSVTATNPEGAIAMYLKENTK